MNELQIIEHQGKRVLTTQQLAEVYGTTSGNISDNFNNHKFRFLENKDYIFLDGEELKNFKNQSDNIGVVDKRSSSLYLWTDRGANRHCKVLGTDQAWEQFDVLEESYFQTRNQSKPLSQLEVLVQSAQALLEHDKAIKQLAATQTQIVNTQDQQAQQLAKLIDIQSHKAEIVKQLPVINPMDQRSQLNQIIRGYSDRNNIHFGEVWTILYDSFLHHFSINLKVRANNRKQKPLDYAQHNGYLPDMLSLAIKLFC